MKKTIIFGVIATTMFVNVALTQAAENKPQTSASIWQSIKSEDSAYATSLANLKKEEATKLQPTIDEYNKKISELKKSYQAKRAELMKNYQAKRKSEVKFVSKTKKTNPAVSQTELNNHEKKLEALITELEKQHKDLEAKLDKQKVNDSK